MHLKKPNGYSLWRCGVGQARALIKNPDTYDPEPNRLYNEFASHYGCALLAARPAHPRDKPKVENAVLAVERCILARLRNRRLLSLAKLNKAIAALLVDLDQSAFKKLLGCQVNEQLRQQQIRALERMHAQFRRRWPRVPLQAAQQPAYRAAR